MQNRFDSNPYGRPSQRSTLVTNGDRRKVSSASISYMEIRNRAPIRSVGSSRSVLKRPAVLHPVYYALLRRCKRPLRPSIRSPSNRGSRQGASSWLARPAHGRPPLRWHCPRTRKAWHPGTDPSQLSSMATDRIIDVGFALSSPWRSGFVIRAGSATASMQMTSRFVLPVATITTS